MDRRTQLALTALNAAFYEQQAAHFNATRGRGWPGWRRLKALLPQTGKVSVVDVGCGNGRLGAFFRQEVGERIAYQGLDESERLLAFAREQLGPSTALGKLELCNSA